MRPQYLLCALFSLFLLLPIHTAAYNMGTYEITIGEEKTVSIDDRPNVTITSTGPRIEGNTIKIISKAPKSCTVQGTALGVSTLKWSGIIGGEPFEFEWTFNVVPGVAPDKYFYEDNEDGISLFYKGWRYEGFTYPILSSSPMENCTISDDKIASANGKLVIPETAHGVIVYKIGKNSIRLLNNLTELVLPSGLRFIDHFGIGYCPNLKTLTCKATIPPKKYFAYGEMIDTRIKENITLYVPKGCVEKYRAADEWKDFKSIKEIGSEPEILINEENFPDKNFRDYLLSQSYGADGELTKAEIEDVWIINVNKKEISSLKGIELFTALRWLYCDDNNLSALDVSKNTALRELWCQDNNLSALDVSKNTALTTLECYGNQLTALDVSKNTSLTSLGCSSNKLTVLDVSKNTSLTTLLCGSNKLTALDVSKNTALTNLSCSSNQLGALDVSKNTALTTLDCYTNHLIALDVSKNTALTTLYCYTNQLTALDVSNNTALTALLCQTNQLKSLDVSKNTALTNLSCAGNQLKSLDVSKNTALKNLNCAGNQIKGSEMDNLIKSLPKNSTGNEYQFRVIYTDREDGNVCTTSQVAAAKEKGWVPKAWNGEKWVNYEPTDFITITVTSVSREYGNDNPKFEYTVIGGTLIGNPEISCTATAKSNVGTYDIVISKGTVENANVKLVGGKLTVTKAPLTISGGTYTMKQGDALPTFIASYSGFKNGETEAVLTKKPTLKTTATSNSKPGTYDVTVSGAEAKNYDIKYIAGKLTITEANPITVTVKSISREYGKENPKFEYTVEGGTLDGTPAIRCTATAKSGVGTYDITIAKGTVKNNNVTLVGGKLTVTKAPLTISGGTYTMKQGEALPTFMATYSGFKNGETEAVLTKKPTLTTTATSASAPGTYEVAISGAEAKNYDIKYVKGTLTITEAAPITVTVKSISREYGDANPTFEYTVDGGTLDGKPEISCAATAKSDVGTYNITIAKGTVKNYNVTFVSGKLTITKASLTISGGTYSMKQGDALPTFKASYSGFKNGDTESVLTKKPTLKTTATSSSAPGTYDVTVSGAEAKNYDIKYVKGTLTITDADPITVTVKSVSREYGNANPSFEFTAEGGTLNGTPEINCEATAASPVGTYPIVIKKGGVTNSNVSYINGTLTITKASLKVSVGNYERNEGEDNPAFKINYNGWKNGEDERVLTEKPTAATTATKSSPAGVYDIVVSGGKAQNYTLNYEHGKLTIKEPPSKWKDGDVFTSKTIEGVEMTFKVISASDKTCQVGIGDIFSTDKCINEDTEGKVTIPVVIEGLEVISIGKSAFRDCSKMTNVTIPDGITTIESFAFQGCKKLTSVYIPATVTSIDSDYYPFGDCDELSSITVDENNPTYDSRSGCNAIVETKTNSLVVGCKNSIIPNSVKSIGTRAFRGCSKLASVVFPNSIEIIKEGAFMFCSALKEIMIPENVINIGSEVFHCCYNLGRITVAENNQIYDSRQGCNAIIHKESKTLVAGCKNSKIPDDVIKIGDKAFYAHYYLTNIFIPNSVKEIGNYAFEYTNLKSINLPEGLTSIGTFAFFKCEKMEFVNSYIEQPFNVEAFEYMAKDCKLIVPRGTKELYEKTPGWNVFSEIVEREAPSLVIEPFSIYKGGEAEVSINLSNPYEEITLVQFDLQLPAGLTLKRNGGKYVCDLAERSPKHSLEVNETGDKIRFKLHSSNNDAISGNSGAIIKMTLAASSSFSSGNIVIDNTLLVSPSKQDFTIGKYSYNVKVDETPPSKWKDGDVFTSKTIEGVDMTFTVISASKKTCQVGKGYPSYEHCIKKDTEGTITIPAMVEGLRVIKIKSDAFGFCRNITNVIIPEGITTIESSAFEYCTKLESVHIPASVTSINTAYNPFMYCEELASITVDGNNTIYDSRNGCNAIVETKTNTLVVGCKNSIIPNTVIGIGKRSFYGCINLTSIVLPNSIETIEEGAFIFCYGLKEILIPENVVNIGAGVFSSCNNIEHIKVAENNQVYDSRQGCNAIIHKASKTLVAGCKNSIIPDDVIRIEDKAFEAHFDLTQIFIPEKVKEIGEKAFSFTKLKSINLPEGLTVIGNNAFGNCDSLRIVQSYIEHPFAVEKILGYSPKDCKLIVPKGSKELYEMTPGWDVFSEIIEREAPSLVIEPFSIYKGGEAEVFINLNNPYEDITLVQFDLQLPAGLTLKRNGGKYVYSMAERSPKHTLEVNETGDKIRFKLHSANNDAISGSSGAIIKMTLAAASSFSSGNIVIDNTLMVSPTKQESVQEAFSYKVTAEELPVPEISLALYPESGSELDVLDEVKLTFTGYDKIDLADATKIELVKGETTMSPVVTPVEGRNNEYILTFGIDEPGTYMLLIGKGAFTFDYANMTHAIAATTAKYVVKVPRPTEATLMAAKELLGRTGIGTPAADSKGRTELETLVATGEGKDEVYEAAMAAFLAETDVELPAVGKFYHIAAVNSKGAEGYVTYENDNLFMTTDNQNVAVFRVMTANDGTLTISPLNSDYECSVTAARLTIESVSAEETFGLFSLYGMLGGNTKAYARVSIENGIWEFINSSVIDKRSGLMMDENMTTAFRFTELTDDEIAADVKDRKVDNGIVSVYTLSGQKLEKPRKGINIIDGRKVVVK